MSNARIIKALLINLAEKWILLIFRKAYIYLIKTYITAAVLITVTIGGRLWIINDMLLTALPELLKPDTGNYGKQKK